MPKPNENHDRELPLFDQIDDQRSGEKVPLNEDLHDLIWGDVQSPEATVQRQFIATNEIVIRDHIRELLPPIIPDPTKKEKQHSEDESQVFEFARPEYESYEIIYPDQPEFTPKFLREIPKIPQEVRKKSGEIVPVPSTWRELALRYNVTDLPSDVLWDRQEQRRGVIISREIDETVFLLADPGFGKTVVQAVDSEIEVREGGRTLVLTTPKLIDQIGAGILDFTSLSEDQIAIVKPNLSPKKRSTAFENKENRVIVTTPGIFFTSLNNNLTSANDFTLALVDEGDLGIGNTHLRQVGEVLRDSPCKIRLHSATLPDKECRYDELLGAFGLQPEKIYKLHSPDKKVFEAECAHRINDPAIVEVAKELYEMVIDVVLDLEHQFQISSFSKKGERAEVKKFLKTFHSMTGLHNDKFSMPDNDSIGNFGKQLRDAGKELGEEVSEKCSSLLAEFGYRGYLYDLLVRFGKVAFLSYVADEGWAYRFKESRKNKKSLDVLQSRRGKSDKGLFFEEVYRGIDKGSRLGELIKKLAPGKLYSEIASTTHWARWRDRYGWTENFRSKFHETALDEIVNDDTWFNGKSTERIQQIALRHSTFGMNDRILVYTESVANTEYYQKLLTKKLSSVNKEVVGCSGAIHQDELSSRLKRFKSGEASVVIGNQVLGRGWDDDIQVLIKESHSPDTPSHKQLVGRLARRGGIAFVYNLYARGTADERRFKVLQRRQRVLRSRGRMDS